MLTDTDDGQVAVCGCYGDAEDELVVDGEDEKSGGSVGGQQLVQLVGRLIGPPLSCHGDTLD